MSKKLSDEDKEWLRSHPGFHIAGDTSQRKERKRLRRRSCEIEREPTLSEKLEDFEAMDSMNDD